MLSKKARILLNRLLAKKGLKKKAGVDVISIAASHILLGAFGTNIKFKVEGKDGTIIEKDISKLNEDDVILVTAQRPDGTITHIPEEEAVEQGFTILESGEIKEQRLDTQEKIKVYKGPSIEVYLANAAKAIKEILELKQTGADAEDKIVSFYRLYGDRKNFKVQDYTAKFQDGTISGLVTADNLKQIYDLKFKDTLSKVYSISKEKYEANKDFYVPAYEPELDENSFAKVDSNGRYVPKKDAEGNPKVMTEKIDKKGTTSFKAIQKQAQKFKGKDLDFIIPYFAGMPSAIGVFKSKGTKPEAKATTPVLTKNTDIKVVETAYNQFKNFSVNVENKKIEEIFEAKKNSGNKLYEGVLFSLSEMKEIAQDESDGFSLTKQLLGNKGDDVLAKISDITKLKEWAKGEFRISMSNIRDEAFQQVQTEKNLFSVKYFEGYGLELAGDDIYINLNSKNLIKTPLIRNYIIQTQGDKKQIIKKRKEEVSRKSPLSRKEYLDPVLQLDKEGFTLSKEDIVAKVDIAYALEFLERYKDYDGIYFWDKGVEKQLKDVKNIKVQDIYTTLENYQSVQLDYKIKYQELTKLLSQSLKDKFLSEKKEIESELLAKYRKKTTNFKNEFDKKIEALTDSLDEEKREGISAIKRDVLRSMGSENVKKYERSMVYFKPRAALVLLEREKKQEVKDSISKDRVRISEVYGGSDFEAYKQFLKDASKVKPEVSSIPWFLQGKKAGLLSYDKEFATAHKTLKFIDDRIGSLPAAGLNSPISSVKMKNLNTLLLQKKQIEAENLRKQVSGYAQQSNTILKEIKKRIAKLKSEIKNINSKPIDFITDSYSFPRTNTGSESSVSPWGSIGYQYSSDLHKAKAKYQEKQDDDSLMNFVKLVAKLVVNGLYNIYKQAKMYNAFIMKGGAKKEVQYEEFFDNILDVQSNSNSAIKSGLKNNIETAIDNFSLKAGAKTIYPLKEIGKTDVNYIAIKNNFTKVLSGEVTKEEFTVNVENILEGMKPALRAKFKDINISDISSSSLIKGVCSSKAVNPKDVAERATTVFTKMVSSTAKGVSEDEELDLTDMEAWQEYETNRMSSENSRRDIKKCISTLSEDSELALELLDLFGDDSYIFSKSLVADSTELGHLTSVVYVKGEDYSVFAEKGSIDYDELETEVDSLRKDLRDHLSSPLIGDLGKFMGLYGKADIKSFDPETLKLVQDLKSKLDSVFSSHSIDNVDYFKFLSSLSRGNVETYLLSVVKNALYPHGLEEPAMEMNVSIKKSTNEDILALNLIKFGLKQNMISFSHDLKSSDLHEIYYSIFQKTYELELNRFKKLKDDAKDTYIKALIKDTELSKTDNNFNNLILFLKNKLCLPMSKSDKKLSSWSLTKKQREEIEKDESIIDAFKEIANANGFLNTENNITVGDFDEGLLNKIGFNYFNRMFERNFSGSNNVFEFKIIGLIKEKSEKTAIEKTLIQINKILGTKFVEKDIFEKEDGHSKFKINNDITKLVVSTTLKLYASLLLLDLANGRKDILSDIFNQEASWWKLFSFSGKASTQSLSSLVTLYKTDLKQIGKFLDNHEALEQHFKSTFKAAPTKFNTTPEEPEETREEKKSSITNLVAKEIASFFDRVNISNEALEIAPETNKVDYIYETLNKLSSEGLNKVINNCISTHEAISESELNSLIVEGEITAKGLKTVEKLYKIKNAIPSDLVIELANIESGAKAKTLVKERDKYLTELNIKIGMLLELKTDLRKWYWEDFSASSVKPLTFSEIFGMSSSKEVIEYLIKNPTLRDSFIEDAISVLKEEANSTKLDMKEVISSDKEEVYKSVLEYVYGRNNSVVSLVGSYLLGYVNDNSIKQKNTKKVVQMILNTMINKA